MATPASRVTTAAGAQQRLMSELRALTKEKWVRIETDNGSLFRWKLALLVINPDSVFHGGYLRAEMTFTDQYPYAPPTFKFLTPICHPNVYPDGKLCISILHTPGEDLLSGEAASERWSPLQGVESVLRSVLLLLDDPEISSPANVDASVLYRDRRADYDRRARETVDKSKKDYPPGFVMPTTLDDQQRPPPEKDSQDDAFWAESDGDDDDDFGGSDTGGEDEDYEEEESEED